MLLVLRAIFICLLFCFNVFAQGGFFDSEVDFFEDISQEKITPTKEECFSCNSQSDFRKEKTLNISQTMKVTMKEIRRNVKKTQTTQNSVILFVSPQCRYSLEAIKEIDTLKHIYPQWRYEIYMLSSMNEYKGFIKENKEIFENEIPFSLDVQAKVSQRFGINQAPTFVIDYNGEYYKVAGQPILKDVIQKLVKK